MSSPSIDFNAAGPDASAAAGSAAAVPPKRSRAGRILRSAPVRIVAGALALGLTAALTFGLIKEALPSPAARFVWPYLLASALLLLVYVGFIKLTERRALPELGLRGAPRELAVGLALGALAVGAAMALLGACGSYRIGGVNAFSSTIAAPLAEMLFVGIFEELLFRALIFRIIERALGSWPALLLSAALFAAAHLGGTIDAVGLLNTALAGLMLSAAWMVTRRLWLCMAIHAAWNYTLGSVFAIAVSGHPAKGWIVGTLEGPTWLTGGAYGLEGSVMAALVIGALFAALYLRARRTGQVQAAHWH